MQYREIIFMIVSPTLASLMILLNAGIISLMTFFTEATKRRKLIYILNLAVADMTLGISIVTVKAMKVFEKSHPQNKTIKDARIIAQTKIMPLSLYISVLSIAVITIDRFVMIFYPIRYVRIRHWKKSATCIFIWLASSTTVFLLHAFVRDIKREYILKPALVLLTVFLVSVSHIQIRRRLMQNNENLNRLQGTHAQRQITTSEKKFTEFCFQSFILFVLCWLPISIYGILYVQHYFDGWLYYLDFRYTCHILAFSNSVLSPILFLVHFKRFKKKQSSNNGDSTATEMLDVNKIENNR